MEMYNNILCISYGELVKSSVNPCGVLSESMYNKLAHITKVLNILRRACKGTTALIEYSTLPERYRNIWESMNGDPQVVASKMSFVGQMELDDKAIRYYIDCEVGDGRRLGKVDSATAMRYAREASVLNTLNTMLVRSKNGSRSAGHSIPTNWQAASDTIHAKEVQASYPHKLPTNPQSLRKRMKKYLDEGYAGLVHAGFANDNKRIVTIMFERLVLALYTMPNKPFNTNVYENVKLFMGGKITIYDRKSGELFEPSMFTKSGEPIEVSESTIWNIINNPLNRIFVDEQRNDGSYNLNKNRPFHRRKSPDYALSKISMDDRDLPRKLHSGEYVKAYYAYDVASGCVIGASYSLTKNEELFLDCMRDMFRNIEKNGWGMPAEVEVENHIVNKFFDDLQLMFTHLKICIPNNHREKRAEHLNRAKKYSSEKKAGHAIGRWWARSEAYLKPSKKVDDKYVEKTFTFNDLVADDLADILDYNMAEHKRKKFAGMSRWQVLTDCLNPNLIPIRRSVQARHVGYTTQTSIRNSKEVTVKGLQFQLSNVSAMARLKPNNRKVTAYYLPDHENVINEVYLYQGDTFISECKYICPYNEAKIEWTDADADSFKEQSKYDAQYRKAVKDSKNDIPKVSIIENHVVREYEPKPIVARGKKPNLDINSLLADYNPQNTINNARKNM